MKHFLAFVKSYYYKAFLIIVTLFGAIISFPVFGDCRVTGIKNFLF